MCSEKVNSRRIDDEGVPTQPTSLVEEGEIFRNDNLRNQK
jgi:predicted Zn-dependent protease